MKTRILKLCAIIGLISIQYTISLQAQTVSTFEDLKLPENSYWNGSDKPLGTLFNSGDAIFPNFYDTSYGGYWTGGWAYSNVQDSTTSGSKNLYSARPASGYDKSNNYAVGQQGSVIKLNSNATGRTVMGFYVTNGTYATISMRDGDGFGKKFGGKSGSDPDWFKLNISKWYMGELSLKGVEFYLADYRFEKNENDYIVKTWQWVDLNSLGNVDSLKFTLSSSDVGQYGMNTPPFFCIDNLMIDNRPLSVENHEQDNSLISIFPNPAKGIVNITSLKFTDQYAHISITDLTGKIVYWGTSDISNLVSIDLNNYPSGIYFVNITGNNISFNQKLIKE